MNARRKIGWYMALAFVACLIWSPIFALTTIKFQQLQELRMALAAQAKDHHAQRP